MSQKSTLVFVGLGKMGANLALNAIEKGYQILGVDPNGVPAELAEHNIQFESDVRHLKEKLPEGRRVVFMYIPAGPVVDHVLNMLASVLNEGDIIVDGGNSYWGDSIRRAASVKQHNIYLIDCGTSGGMSGARNGACFMYGGEQEPADYINPILTDLAVPDGVVYTGPSGSGHYVKLVHNGIEFGMLQAIGEGLDLLMNYRDQLPMQKILHTWNHGSVIRSWLVELMEQQYSEQNGVENVPAYIEDTGEVNWLVDDAMRMEVPIPVIAQSVMQLFASRDNHKNWARAIAMMRHGFGGHPFGEDAHIKYERQAGRIGQFPPIDKDKSNG